MSPEPTARRPRSAVRGFQARPGTCKGPRRPSSACPTKWGDRQIGQTPWVASIGGGIHASYAAIGQPQVQPILADPQRSVRSTPPAPAAPGFELKVDIPSAKGLVDNRELPPDAEPERRLTFCPRVRAKGFCRLPSCTYVHEVCRPRREFDPLYCANAPRSCKMIPCRFFAVLGFCPHGDSCIYSHAAPSPEVPQVAIDAWSTDIKANPTREVTEAAQSSEASSEEPRRKSVTASCKRPRAPKPAAGRPASSRVSRAQSSKQKPTLPQMAFLGIPPDLGCGGKDRPLSGGIAVLDAMADRRVTVTAG